MSLPIFNRNQGNILKARAELIAAENEVRRVELALQERLAAAFKRYDNARYRAKEYSANLLPNAKESLELVLTAQKLGEFDYLTLLTAQRTYTQVSLAHLQKFEDPHSEDWLRINRAAGMSLGQEADMCLAFSRGKALDDLG